MSPWLWVLTHTASSCPIYSQCPVVSVGLLPCPSCACVFCSPCLARVNAVGCDLILPEQQKHHTGRNATFKDHTNGIKKAPNHKYKSMKGVRPLL